VADAAVQIPISMTATNSMTPIFFDIQTPPLH